MQRAAQQPVCNGTSALEPAISSAAFAGKRILITGAGGWIGSALAQALCAEQQTSLPKQILLLDASEGNLYAVDAALHATGSGLVHTAILGSVTDAALLGELFATHAPQIVFHAAACKHVPLLESNPLAALWNNAIGTCTLLEAAQHCTATEQFLMVSTDKAAHPCGIMGASKRIAELAVLASAHPTLQTKVARLVNVYGAPGSVVPLFLQQIACGGPLTVTHPEAERYFIDLPQAIALLLAIASPSVGSGLYLPRVSAPEKILDLARRLLSEREAPDTVKIRYTGLRPGEKRTETLLAPQEVLDPNAAASDRFQPVQTPRPPATELSAALCALTEAVAQRRLDDALRWVRRIVPEYAPTADPDGAHAAYAALTGAQR